MQKLLIPEYRSKTEVYAELHPIMSYIPREDVFLAHFKTPEFITTEQYHNVVPEQSVRNTSHDLEGYNIPVMPGLEYKIATCLFSENTHTFGLAKHIHRPKTTLPTITVGKKVLPAKDDVVFQFSRPTSPPSINLVDDFVLRFDSCTMPHEIVVPDHEQSIWLFIVFEHCNNVSLDDVKNFYDCKVIYDHFQ